ncbi:MAG: hypothetical protein ACP5SH_22240 [Syntrophobacteraceae bacterium]
MRSDGEEMVVYWDTSAVLSSLFSDNHSDKALEWANRDGFHLSSKWKTPHKPNLRGGGHLDPPGDPGVRKTPPGGGRLGAKARRLVEEKKAHACDVAPAAREHSPVLPGIEADHERGRPHPDEFPDEAGSDQKWSADDAGFIKMAALCLP